MRSIELHTVLEFFDDSALQKKFFLSLIVFLYCAFYLPGFFDVLLGFCYHVILFKIVLIFDDHYRIFHLGSDRAS